MFVVEQVEQVDDGSIFVFPVAICSFKRYFEHLP